MNAEKTKPENFDGKDTVETVPYIVYEMAQARQERTIQTMQEKHEKTVKTLVAIIITAFILLFATNLVWIWYINQYDFSNCEVSTDGGGDAYYNELVGDGQINYGESDCSQAN